MNLKTLISSILLIAIIAVATVFAVTFIIEYMFPSTGIIIKTDAKVYFENELMADGDGINWGDLTPGQTISGNLTVINTGTTTINITLYVLNLPPYLTTAWAANKTSLSPGSQNSLYLLSLTVNPDAPAETFNFTYRLDIMEVS